MTICQQVALAANMDIELENEKGEVIPLNATWEPTESLFIVCKRVPGCWNKKVDGAAMPTPSEVMREEEDNQINRIINQQSMDSLYPPGAGDATAPGGPVLRYSKSYRQAVKVHERKEAHERKVASRGSGDIGADTGASATEGGEEKEEEKKKPPADYVCNRCGRNDHYVWDCPTNDDPDHIRKVRTAKGIPRCYLTKVKDVDEAQSRALGGVTLVIPGNSAHYVWSHNPDKQEHKDRVGDTIQDKVVTAFSDGAKQVEESLKCPLCRGLFREAMLAPCCGASFCNSCAIERLCHHGPSDSKCPNCDKTLMAHKLIPNDALRNQVDAVFKASTKEKKIEAEVAQREKETPIYSFTKHSRGSKVIFPSSSSLSIGVEAAEKPDVPPAEIETVDLSKHPDLRNAPPVSAQARLEYPPLQVVPRPPHASAAVMSMPSVSGARIHGTHAGIHGMMPSSSPATSSTGHPTQHTQHTQHTLPSQQEWQFPPAPPSNMNVPPPQLGPFPTLGAGIPAQAVLDGRPSATAPMQVAHADPRQQAAMSQPWRHPLPTEAPPKILEKEDFELLQTAWKNYYDHVARKEKRRISRLARSERRAKKLKKMEERIAKKEKDKAHEEAGGGEAAITVK